MNSRNFLQTQGGKTAPLKFTLFDQFFSFLPKMVALVFTVIFIEKQKQKQKTTPSHLQIGPIRQDDGFFEDFSVVRPKA